jgi:hypothetical protein
MYDFPRAYSFEFQMAALLTKCEQLQLQELWNPMFCLKAALILLWLTKISV